jgi:MinD superfamily P-loop ATPase
VEQEPAEQTGAKLIISIASGKGGTGKTTVATNLAAVSPVATCYADCDVEEPNGHIFLRPDILKETRVTRPIPQIDESRCDLCGLCAETCRFNALAVHPRGVSVFEDLCHACGGCTLACPIGAITEIPRDVGVVMKGLADEIDFLSGQLNIGEAIIPPVVNAVKKDLPEKEITIIDASPGTSCPVIAAVQGTDYCLLVTEPTPFGLNDLTLAVEMVRKMKIPFGVVINRSGIGNGDTEQYCESEGIPVLTRIPDDRRIAEAYSRGEMIVDALPELRQRFLELLSAIIAEAKAGAGERAGQAHTETNEQIPH